MGRTALPTNKVVFHRLFVGKKDTAHLMENSAPSPRRDVRPRLNVSFAENVALTAKNVLRPKRDVASRLFVKMKVGVRTFPAPKITKLLMEPVDGVKVVAVNR